MPSGPNAAGPVVVARGGDVVDEDLVGPRAARVVGEAPALHAVVLGPALLGGVVVV
jgi:hypothetical protein